MTQINPDQFACPLPTSQHEHVVLGHGSGGMLSAELIEQVFLPAFDNDVLAQLEDQATLDLAALHASGARLAVTTDSYVVQPLFFPGGDIGKLAVHGTVNDLAVGGARPLYLAAGFILEEGLALDELRRITASMRTACDEAGVTLVTGDTKVIDRQRGDGLYINTTGIGMTPAGRDLSARHARPGDRIVVSGTIGDHGIAIMSLREGIEFDTPLRSDTAALHELTQTALEAAPSLRCMRDPTRGGLASTLNEWAHAANVGVKVDEAALPMREEVRGACEMLGLDPLYVANEGKFVAVVPPTEVEQLLQAVRMHPLGRDAAIIGEVVDDHADMVVLRSLVGGERVVTMLAGEQLPRIC